MKRRNLYLVIGVFVVTTLLVGAAASAGLFKPFGFTWGKPAATAATRSPMSSALVDQGKILLYARNNIIGARDKFFAAVNADPADKEAQFYYGITRILAIYETGYSGPAITSIRGLAELAGVSFVGTGAGGEVLSYGLYNTSGQGAAALPNSTPRTSDALDFFRNYLLPEIEGSLVNLSNASDPGFISSLLPTALDPSANNVAINVDYGDLLIMKAALYAMKTSIEILLVYNLDVYLPPLANGDVNDVIRVRNLIINHPNVLTSSEAQRLENAKTALTNLVDTFKMGVTAIRARAVAANHLFVLDIPLNLQTNEVINNTSTDTDSFVSFLDDIKASLNGPRDFIASMPDEPDFRKRTFDGSKFFNSANPINLRDKILDTNGDLYLNDLTFGGVAPYGIEGISDQIPLFPGWNLVFLPVIPMDLSISSVLAPIAGKYAIVWGYDTDAGWKKYKPGAGNNSLAFIEANRAFWIYANQFCVLPLKGAHPPRSVSLKKGWNLVGCPGFVAGGTAHIIRRDAAVSLSRVGGLKYVWGIRNGWIFRSPIITTPLFPLLTHFQSPYGYWINVQNDTLYAPPPFDVGAIDGYEVWVGNNDGGDVWTYKDEIIENPASFRYVLLATVRQSDPAYTSKTFALNDQYKYFVIRPANPIGDQIKIDSLAVNGQCIGTFYQGVSLTTHHTDDAWRIFYPSPPNCSDGVYASTTGKGGLMGIKDTYQGVPALNNITIYGVR
jgi:hypothetical protein